MSVTQRDLSMEKLVPAISQKNENILFSSNVILFYLSSNLIVTILDLKFLKNDSH